MYTGWPLATCLATAGSNREMRAKIGREDVERKEGSASAGVRSLFRHVRLYLILLSPRSAIRSLSSADRQDACCRPTLATLSQSLAAASPVPTRYLLPRSSARESCIDQLSVSRALQRHCARQQGKTHRPHSCRVKPSDSRRVHNGIDLAIR
jgi:hypothetical protein